MEVDASLDETGGVEAAIHLLNNYEIRLKANTMTSTLSSQTHSALLPDGYTQRPAALSDAEAVAQVYTAAAHARGESETFTAEVILHRWQNPPCDLATSSQVILNPQGEIIACLSLWDALMPTHP